MLRLQELLLPSALPEIGCTEAAAAYRAHNDELRLGGDWYDVIDRPDTNSVVAIIGDVVGHGADQIGVMGQLRSASHALCGPCFAPHEILDHLACSRELCLALGSRPWGSWCSMAPRERTTHRQATRHHCMSAATARSNWSKWATAPL